MIFKVDKNYTIILNPEAVKLCPELSCLTQAELLFVILVEDYCDSPFRKKPFEERWSLAFKKVFGSKDVNLEDPRIRVAREAYKSLVFDIRRETKDIYLTKIRRYQTELLSQNIEFRHMKELDQMIQYLEERVQAIDTSLDTDDMTNIHIKGDKQLSYVEIWQRRQQEFRKFKETS